MTGISRRMVLATGSAAGAAFALGFAGLKYMAFLERENEASGDQINAWVLIDRDGRIVIRVNSADMGQGAQTGLAQIVADEMDADWSNLRVEMAPVIDRYLVKDGGYYTGGSSSIRPQFDMFAKAGATARAMLIAAAARHWNVSVDECDAQSGKIIHRSSQRHFLFGDVAADAAREAVPRDVSLKASAKRALIGKPVPRLDIPGKVDGSAIYGTDVQLPGMLTASVAQCPFFGGSLAGVDQKPALAVKGVRQVVQFENAVVVVAGNSWSAQKGLAALEPKWLPPEAVIASDDAMFQSLAEALGAPDSSVFAKSGENIATARQTLAQEFANAAKVFEADYQVSFLSHSAMEPMNATARVTSEGCELWAPMQNQSGMRSDVAKALGLAEEKVVLHTTVIGGGFGRRLETDYGVLAARTAKAIGAPVKVLWSREEDMTHDFYRPASSTRMRAAVDHSGQVRALDYAGATVNDRIVGGMAGNYGFHCLVRQKRIDLNIAVGSWRSVDPSIAIFFLESFIDEIAHSENKDAVEFRRALLVDNARGRRVLEAAARMANWGHTPQGHFQGVAFFNHAYWGTAVCEIVELSVSPAKVITLHKVFCAIDPGTAINPNQVMAQAEGGIILGLSAALGEAITLKGGRVEQTNFDTYPILTLAAAPAIEVEVLESPEAAIGGCGEPPVPPAAPALANALFAATGQRIRRLPLSVNGFRV